DCGVCNGENINLDDCGVCFGNNEDKDCNGDCFGTAVIDDCGICSEGNTGYDFNADLDDCGVCFGNNEDIDCAGDCAPNTPVGCEDENNNGECGTAIIDDCGVCSGGNTNHEYNSDIDCNGDCFGGSVIDECGICGGDGESCAVYIESSIEIMIDEETLSDESLLEEFTNNFEGLIETQLGLPSGTVEVTNILLVETRNVNVIIEYTITLTEEELIETDFEDLDEILDILADVEENIESDDDLEFIYGCTDQIACNFEENANVDDGSCSYPPDYYDCDGNCIDDIDSDGLCADIDECPLDPENDIDNDGVCGDVDQCPGYDDNIDTDYDGLADGCDECPNDADNDADSDGICGDIDICPNDYFNDIDGDGICGDVDQCPLDSNNDIDGDGLCDCTLEDIDECPYEPDECPNDADNDADGDGVCGDVDQCPGYDDNIDTDNDGIADGCDQCPGYDDNIDTDYDGLADGCDECPLDPENDADGDGVCGDVDQCEGFDDNIDTDFDGIADGCDECPLDPENDADGDGVCCSDGDGDGVIDDPYCECAADFYDCAGECGGDAYIDDCGVCDDIVENDNETCTGCTDETAENFDENATILCEDCCEYAPIAFDLLTPVDGTEIIFNENDYDALFINFAWEESTDQNTDDVVSYNVTVTNINTGEVELALTDYAQEVLPVPLSFIIDDPVEGEDVVFNWEVIAQDDSEGQYETPCNQVFEFTLRFESLGIEDTLIPDTYVLGDSYPNPFNPVTTIEYGLPEASMVELSVYDIHGKLIKTLDQGSKVAGYYSIVWNAQNVPTGTYFIRLITPEYTATRKVSLIK
ncbi:MAG: hypothetical protein CMF87_05730, partial [Candidatus Marinimicrobia bacterium]|nr:hypothetical protein [Candidatus Neomarinimicrobiota bacterium]